MYKDHHNEIQSDEVINIINVVDTYLQWKQKNGPSAKRRYDVYHPSAFGQCLRKMQYQRYEYEGLLKKHEDDFKPRILRIFDTGHSMHDRWAKYFEEIGVLRGIWECSNPLCSHFSDDGEYVGENTEIKSNRVFGKENKIGIFKPEKCSCGNSEFIYNEISIHDKRLNFSGHVDQILDFSNFDPSRFKKGNPVDVLFDNKKLPKKPIILDMKTANSNSFKNKLKYGPHDYYKVQLNIYMNILDCDYSILIYENKDDSSTKVFQIHRDKEMWNTIQNQALLMNDMVDKRLLPPPKPDNKSSFDCKTCAYRKTCHSSKIWDDPDLDNKRKKFYNNF